MLRNCAEAVGNLEAAEVQRFCALVDELEVAMSAENSANAILLIKQSSCTKKLLVLMKYSC